MYPEHGRCTPTFDGPVTCIQTMGAVFPLLMEHSSEHHMHCNLVGMNQTCHMLGSLAVHAVRHEGLSSGAEGPIWVGISQTD